MREILVAHAQVSSRRALAAPGGPGSRGAAGDAQLSKTAKAGAASFLVTAAVEQTRMGQPPKNSQTLFTVSPLLYGKLHAPPASGAGPPQLDPASGSRMAAPEVNAALPPWRDHPSLLFE